MNVRRGGLGRGLGALIPAGPVEDVPSGARFEEVPVASIEPNPKQPREVFDEDALAELVTSIREVGVLQPVVVREVDPGRYQLIMGERRWRASREAGLDLVPAIIRETSDDHLLRDALLENLHRQQLNPLEEAAAYQQLLHEFGATHDELAERIGRSRSQVSNTIRLLALPPAVQRRVAAGVLSAGHARALLALADPAGQERLAARIVAEGMSVRATEEAVASDRGEAPGSRRPQLRAAQPAALRSLADALSDRLETRVLAELGRSRGKLIVEFASLQDLRRVMSILAPDLGHIVSQEESGSGHELDHGSNDVSADFAAADGEEVRPDATPGDPVDVAAVDVAAVDVPAADVEPSADPASNGDGTEYGDLPVAHSEHFTG